MRNDVGIYVGQPQDYVDSCYIYFPDTKRVMIRGSVYKLEMSTENVLKYFQRRKDMRELSSNSSNFIHAMDDILYNFEKSPEEHGGSNADEPPNHLLSVPLFEKEPAVPPHVRRQPRSAISSDRVFRSAQSKQDFSANSVSMETEDSHEPIQAECSENVNDEAVRAYATKVTSKQALREEDRDKWLAAIQSEWNMLEERDTLREEKPQGRNGNDYKIIHSTLQLKVKLKDNGTVDKYKASLCARGDMLSGLIDETYSPTVSALAHATAHQIAIIDGMHMCSVDVTGAYLYEEYPAKALPLYVKLEPHVAEALGKDPNATYRINKYLYGLPDSDRAYYQGYSAHLEINGYKRTVSDPCLFVKITNTARTYVWIHVDDTIVASTVKEELEEFKRVIGLKYAYTVQEDLDSFLGVHIHRNTDGSVRLTQPKLLAELFQEYKPEEMRGTSRVRTPQTGQEEDDDQWDDTPIERIKYLHLLGALIYVTKSRPDIATAVSFAATHAVRPTEGAYKELLRCVQYLYNTQDAGLVLRAGVPDAELKLRC